MSIQKFNSAENKKLFYIDKDVIENCVYRGTFNSYKKQNVKTRFKTTWIYVDVSAEYDFNDEITKIFDERTVEVCNRDCYRTFEEAVAARIQRNAELEAKLAEYQKHARNMINGYKRNLASLQDALEFILKYADVDDYQLSAFTEKVNEFTGLTLSTDEVGSRVYHEYE